MNGFETIAAIKQESWANEAVYVAYTANNDPVVMAKIWRAGFHHFVLKAGSGYERFEEILSAIRGA